MVLKGGIIPLIYVYKQDYLEYLTLCVVETYIDGIPCGEFYRQQTF